MNYSPKLILFRWFLSHLMAIPNFFYCFCYFIPETFFFPILNLLGWHYLIKLYRLQMWNSIINHLYCIVCNGQQSGFWVQSSGFTSQNPRSHSSYLLISQNSYNGPSPVLIHFNSTSSHLHHHYSNLSYLPLLELLKLSS